MCNVDHAGPCASIDSFAKLVELHDSLDVFSEPDYLPMFSNFLNCYCIVSGTRVANGRFNKKA